MPKEEKKKEKYEVKDIATQTEPYIVDNESGDAITVTQAICKVMNDVETIKKSLS